ncbi:MAG TPA: AAA family ATPase [Phenylobacterium sp.]|jgi:class 3 adenylate cyclase/tetratricopeptide (TPR) repeat protein
MRDSEVPSERSIITVLAADIVGSTRHIAACDPDDAQTFYDHWFEYVRDAVENAGGTLVHYAGDGGIAVFGWPSPLEDHADRACAAAWEIQRANNGPPGPDGRAVQFRVGVHSGLAALRQINRGGISRFDTVGATVNIAAKLQQCAPSGGVLVSAQAARLCRSSELSLTPHSPSPTFGAVQIDAFELDARPDRLGDSDVAHRYSSPMVGRDDEFATLRDMLPKPGGESSSVALIGEAGIGKSRLAAAAISEALARDVNIRVFFGDAQKRTTPFAAARGLIEDLLRQSGAVSREDMRAALAVAALKEDELTALEALFALPVAGLRDKGGKLTETQLARVLVNSFCALALDRPTIVLIEDLHLIDPESRQFLRLLIDAKTPSPFLLVLTGRPEALDEARGLAGTVIQLEALRTDAMQDLVRQLWPKGEPPGPILDRLVHRADGIPFVLEELVRSMESSDLPGFEVLPHSVESVIHARLQRLSPSAKALAQALSLLGEDVDIEFVGAVLGAAPGAIADDLAELERFAFIHPVTGHATHMRHQIITEACADTIPHERRRELHRTAVEAITSRYESLSGRYEKLAFHAESSGDDNGALGYLWEAGLEARRNSAAASLNLIFDRALELIDRIGEAAEEKYVDFVLMAFALVVQLGEFDKMKIHLPRVVDLARRHGRPKMVCNSLSQLGMICWFEGRYAAGLRAAEEGLAMARELRSPVLTFSNQIMLANLLHSMGRLDRAIAEVRELCEMLTGELELARLGAPAIPRSMALAFLSWFMMDKGQYSEGLVFAEDGLAIAVREQEPYSEVLARLALGRNLIMLNRNTDAVECLAVARYLSERNGYDAIKANLAGRIAIALSRTGRMHEAIEIIEDCLRKGLHLRTGQHEVYCLHAGYAEALVRSGETDRGLYRLAEALSIARRVNNPCLIVDGLGLRARMLSLVSPKDPRIEADLAERDEVCKHYGVAAWPPTKPTSAQPLPIA